MLLPLLKHFERKLFYIHDSSEDNKTNDKLCLKEKQHLTDILKVNNCYFQFSSDNRLYSNKRKERLVVTIEYTLTRGKKGSLYHILYWTRLNVSIIVYIFFRSIFILETIVILF